MRLIKGFVLIIIIGLFISCSKDAYEKTIWNLGKKYLELYEMGFYQGQKAAMENKFAISKDKNGIYYWKVSPYTFDKDYNKYKNKGFDVSIHYVIKNEED
jgi:hypothetical protein